MSGFESPDSGASGEIPPYQEQNPAFPPPASAAPQPPYLGGPADSAAGSPAGYPPQQPGYGPPPGYGQASAGYGQAPAGYGQAPGYGAPLGYGQAPGYGPPGFNGVGYGIPPYGAMPGTNGMSIAALVCGICGFMCGFPAILGIIFGCVGLSQTKQTGQSGRGMAIAGIIIGSVYVVLIAALIGSHMLFAD